MASYFVVAGFKEAWTKRLDPVTLPRDFVPQDAPLDLADLSVPLVS